MPSIWKQGPNVHFLGQNVSLWGGKWVEGVGYDAPGVPSVAALKMMYSAAVEGLRQGGAEADVTWEVEGEKPADIHFTLRLTRRSDEKTLDIDTTLALSDHIRNVADFGPQVAKEKLIESFRNNGAF